MNEYLPINSKVYLILSEIFLSLLCPVWTAFIKKGNNEITLATVYMNMNRKWCMCKRAACPESNFYITIILI